MRSMLILAMFAASLGHAAFNEYEEVRDLKLDAAKLGKLSIEAGAGSLEITGVAGLDAIVVTAIIQVPTASPDKAQQVIESGLVLTLQQDGDEAVLKGYFNGGAWGRGDSPSVRLDVRVPARLGLDVDDGSGSIVINGVSGDIQIEDGSGSITMRAVGGSVGIEDGSGSISVTGVGADLRIRDGSGSITVRQVGGSVIVDDGSGSINVSDVERDLIIENAGSGGLNFSAIKGRVEQDG
ncbi:MAG: hypothetical protein BMS9Abin32_610 [Gammaproteobacteria bacterium]|nr:MAG: hypothetical protein BMS9Abin32_610 [Gammaproteobacteria bacterium]